MKQIKDQAIVLRTRPYREADGLIIFFSKEGGKRSGLARGLKRSKKRFHNALEIGSQTDILYETKPNRDLDLLKEASLIHHTPSWRKTWEAIAAVAYVLELADRLLPPHQKAIEKFHLLSDFLETIGEGRFSAQLLAFEYRWLTFSGWEPHTDHCGICGQKWKEGVLSQRIFDHYWEHILGKPLLSKGLLNRAILM